MINSMQLYKAGRETKILEVNDHLQVNDFYNKTGYPISRIHGKMSRIQFVLIDVSNGKGDKANIQKFAFTVEEWEDLFNILRYGEAKFVTVCREVLKKDNYMFTKANSYKKIGDKIEIRKIKITFENGLTHPKWKIYMENGKAYQKKDGFGYDTNSYQRISYAYFMIEPSEMKDLIRQVSKYISLWEQYSFGEFILNRNMFKERAKENSYDEKDMSWNENPNLNQTDIDSSIRKTEQLNKVNGNNNNSNRNIKKNNTISNSKETTNEKNVVQGEFHCSKCNAIINPKMYKNSTLVYGKALCQECTKNEE